MKNFVFYLKVASCLIAGFGILKIPLTESWLTNCDIVRLCFLVVLCNLIEVIWAAKENKEKGEKINELKHYFAGAGLWFFMGLSKSIDYLPKEIGMYATDFTKYGLLFFIFAFMIYFNSKCKKN